MAKWQPAVNSTYGSTTTKYTSEVEGPMRLEYPGQGKAAPAGELLTSLTEVVRYPNPSISLMPYFINSAVFFSIVAFEGKKSESENERLFAHC